MPLKMKKKPKVMDVTRASPVSEAYRTLRTNLDLQDEINKPKVITVTSAQPFEGKTTIAANLAMAFAQLDKQVLLIDAVLRIPSLHNVFSIQNNKGLSSLLRNKQEIHEAICSTHIPNLFVLTAGPIPINPTDILSSTNLTDLINEYRSDYDMVIIDTPAALSSSDPQIIAAKSDGVLLVVQYGQINKEMIKKVKSNMDKVKKGIIGVVINKNK